MAERYAHSLYRRPVEEWEKLSDHLDAVAARAACFAGAFGWADVARAAGLLHDIGKCSDEFLTYIKKSAAGEDGLRGPDHSTAGARVAIEKYGVRFGRMLAHIIAGHHAGLSDWQSLGGRLGPGWTIPRYDSWQQVIPKLPDILTPTVPPNIHANPGLTLSFLIRMLFSCLVDADFLETERFYARAKGEGIERGNHLGLEVLRDRLRASMSALQDEAASRNPGKLNNLRADVLRHAVEKAASEPGLFTLTVPTGGGKTLASLSFALEHAVRHGLQRVMVVIPYTGAWIETSRVTGKRGISSRALHGRMDRNDPPDAPGCSRDGRALHGRVDRSRLYLLAIKVLNRTGTEVASFMGERSNAYRGCYWLLLRLTICGPEVKTMSLWFSHISGNSVLKTNLVVEIPARAVPASTCWTMRGSTKASSTS